VTSTILLDGRVLENCDFAENAEPSVKLFLFEEFEDDVVKRIELRAKKIRDFISGKEIQTKELGSMVSLIQRTAR